jgi:FkbM family methyltransferase
MRIDPRILIRIPTDMDVLEKARNRYALAQFIENPTEEYPMNTLNLMVNHTFSSETPFFSIVIPIHNQEKVIRSHLGAAIRNMTEKPFEVILILDACSDGTKKEVECWISDIIECAHPILLTHVVILESSMPLFETAADNLGFFLGEGEYVLEIQADIEITEKGYNMHLLEPFKHIPELLGISGRGCHSLTRTECAGRITRNVEYPMPPEYQRNLVYIAETCIRGPLLLNKAKLVEMGYLDEKHFFLDNSDHDLFARAYKEKGWTCGYIPIDYISVLDNGSTRKVRDALNEEHFQRKKARYLTAGGTLSYSQLGQDLEVLKLFNNKQNGYFLDIGAFDGKSYSNSLLLEESYGWQGICVEPLPDEYAKLIQIRKCKTSNKALYHTSNTQVKFTVADMLSGITDNIDHHTHVKDNTTITVETITPTDLLQEMGAPTVIDYMSLDTEGSELAILQAFDFSKYTVLFINVEHNYEEPRRTDMRILLESHGYLYFGSRAFDDNYLHRSFIEGTYFRDNDYSKAYVLEVVDIDTEAKVRITCPIAPVHTATIDFGTMEIISPFLGRGKLIQGSIEFPQPIQKDTRESIVFVGANDMTEIQQYIGLYNKGIFIEAIPYTARYLEKFLNGINLLYNTEYRVVNALCTSENDKKYEFHVYNNKGASSSIFLPNMENWTFDVKPVFSIPLTSITLDTLLETAGWKESVYDMVLDVQGAELEVLKGFTGFEKLECLYTEISRKEIYTGGVLFEDLDAFLKTKGFHIHPDTRKNIPEFHGDVLYVRY